MSKSVELNLRNVFGALSLLAGLMILGYVALMAGLLATGTMSPLRLYLEQQIGTNSDIFFGIVLQIGMFSILVAVAYILIKSGLTLILQKT